MTSECIKYFRINLTKVVDLYNQTYKTENLKTPEATSPHDTGRECGGARELTGLPWAAADVLEGYFNG